MLNIIEHIAYLTAPDGTRFQVLKPEVLGEDGTPLPREWDEEATSAAANDYVAGLVPPPE
jgi:hypothetical protein